MKLKKIASLALAGIMAVSMLAGCGTNNGGSSDNGNTVVEPTVSGIAKAFNDNQAATNKAKVAFTSDSTLDAQLAQAVKEEGEDATAALVEGQLRFISGILDDGAYAYYAGNSKDGLVTTNLYVIKLSSSEANNTVKYAAYAPGQNGATANGYVGWVYNADAAMKATAQFVNTYIASLLYKTTYVEGQTLSGQDYFDYDYTGKASMVTAKTANGDTNYYIAFTITQTCTEGTVA